MSVYFTLGDPLTKKDEKYRNDKGLRLQVGGSLESDPLKKSKKKRVKSMSLAEQFVRQRKEIKDPRSDLIEDSQTWQDFLIIAKAKYYKDDPEFWWILHGFRCMGTRLVRGQSGGYVLRPLVDERLGFQDGEYEEMRDKYLKPHVKKIKEVLDMLGRKARLKR